MIWLTVAGWAAAVAGAVLQYLGAPGGPQEQGDGTFTIETGHPWLSRAGLVLTVAGSTCGLVGTIASL